MSSQHYQKEWRVVWVRGLIKVSPARYGLPVSYQALLLQTDSKHSKKLREELDLLFMHLDPTATASKIDVREQTHPQCFHCCIHNHEAKAQPKQNKRQEDGRERYSGRMLTLHLSISLWDKTVSANDLLTSCCQPYFTVFIIKEELQWLQKASRHSYP